MPKKYIVDLNEGERESLEKPGFVMQLFHTTQFSRQPSQGQLHCAVESSLVLTD